MMCLCDQLRKLVAQVRPVGRMSLEPWMHVILVIFLTKTALYLFCPLFKYFFLLHIKVYEKMNTNWTEKVDGHRCNLYW